MADVPPRQPVVRLQTSDDTDQYSSFQPVSFKDANGELFQYVPATNDVATCAPPWGKTVVTFPDGGQELDTYLRNPDGTTAAQDGFKNYEPTALPVAAGGYYWVVFTSRRSYGNTIDNSDPDNTPPNVKPKKLWVAALDINGNPPGDTSHPPSTSPARSWAPATCAGSGRSPLASRTAGAASRARTAAPVSAGR